MEAEETAATLAPERDARKKKTLHDDMAAVERCIHEVLKAHAHDPLEAIALEHLDTGGKRLRARLALSACAALGLSPLHGAPLAAACELLHNATLIHDDLQDGDTMRRGRPAVWARHGAAQAINAGDLLLMLPFLALEHAHCDDGTRWRLTASLARRAARTACGQSLEQCLLEQQLLHWDAWELSASGKTGAFFALPFEGAALMAGLDAHAAAAIGDAVLPLGVLFQLQDDILDLYGDKGREQRGNDLREGKISALVVAHLDLHPADTADVLDVLRAPRLATRDEDVARLSARFVDGGALAVAAQRARDLYQRTLHAPPLLAHPALHALAIEIADTIYRPLERASAHPTLS
jgi:geranylgeranyl diphosphate synthase type I